MNYMTIDLDHPMEFLEIWLNDIFPMVMLILLGTIIWGVLTSVTFLRKKPACGFSLLPPVVRTIPFVGGVVKFLRGPMLMLEEEYERLGSVFTIKLVTKTITFLIGPDVSKHFFKATEADMSQKEVYKFNVPTFGPGVVYDVDYSIRMEQFRFCSEALKVSSLRQYVDYMVEEAELFFSKWGDEGVIDLKSELEHLVVLTASRSLLGREVRDQLLDNVKDLFSDLEKGMQPISVLFPYLPTPAHRQRDRSRKKLEDIFSRIIQNRRSLGRVETDMLQAFMDSKYKSTGRATTESEITGLLIATLFGGQRTSSITASWIGAYLMRFKDYMVGAVEEQKTILKIHGKKLDYDILKEMDLLHRSMKEALRLHPPLIMLFRYCHKDFHVKTREGKEYLIPKGHIVGTSPAFANRLPHIYKQPNKFDPDRFAAGREEDKVAGAFSCISFGGGKHGCLGETFAYMEVKTIWTIMLRNFELELVSPFPEPDWKAMVVGPKGNLIVHYKRRELTLD